MTEVIAGAGVAVGFLVGILAHELAHHRLATSLGDHSPKLYGRLSLSFKAHADPLGSYIMPAIFVAMVVFAGGFLFPPFGWAKPHALNLRALRNQRRDPILVALAGPIATGILAVVAGAIARGAPGRTASVFFGMMAVVFVALTVFELLPIPGRDGARILQRFLSPQAAMKMDELADYHVLFLLVLFAFLTPVAAGILRAGCGLLNACP